MNDFLRFIAVISCSIMCCIPIAALVGFLVKRLTALLLTKRTKNDTLEQAIKEKRRNKNLRILAVTIAFLLIATILYFAVIRSFAEKREYAGECEQLKSASVGDTILWGRYDTNPSLPGKERVSWIILEKDSESALLISEMGLAGSYYHQHHTEISWKDCDLRNLINSGPLSKSFSNYELDNMIPIDGDLVSLLTAGEAKELFSTDEDRELIITAVAKAQGTNINDLSKHHEWDMTSIKTSWWWLKTDNNETSITAPIVTVDGVISTDEKYVNKPGGAIRPVIRVKIN